MNLLNYLPIVNDFPKPGIQFRDILPLLADPIAFSYAIDQLHSLSSFCEYDYVLGIESRGFIFATAIAQASKKGLILARKPNKTPKKVHSEHYGLEYGSDSLEIQQGILPNHSRVLLIDDVLATGGTLIAAGNLIRRVGGNVAGALVLLEITELFGEEKIRKKDILSKSLIKV